METRETKDRVDSIKMATQRMSANIAGLKKEQKKTNELLEKILDLLEEDARRTKIKMGY